LPRILSGQQDKGDACDGASGKLGEMCARYCFFSGKTFGDDFGAVPIPDLGPLYSVFPGQAAPVVVSDGGVRRAVIAQWGLVPSWANDPSIGKKLFNARAETLAEKPSFRTALRKRRCIVPADGFFEWSGEKGSKQGWFATLDRRPFAMAGLWEYWEGVEGALQTFTVITTAANEEVEPVHSRMPVILEPHDYTDWLREDAAGESLTGLLTPFPPGRVRIKEVGKAFLYEIGTIYDTNLTVEEILLEGVA